MSKKIKVTERQFNVITGNNNLLKEMRPNSLNNGNMIPVCEARVMNMINRHSENGYIIISPCRSERTPEENNKAMQAIVADIKKSGYSYTPVYGGFIENMGTDSEKNVYEKSFIVYNRDKKGNTGNIENLYELGIELSKKYGQESFLFKAPNDVPKYITQTGEVDMEFTNNPSFNDFNAEYFTALHRKNNKSGRFTFNESYIYPSPQTYSERHTRYMNGEIFL